MIKEMQMLRRSPSRFSTFKWHNVPKRYVAPETRKRGLMEKQKAGKRRGNADWHVSMGARERFGVRESCIIGADQWEGRDEMFKGSVLATAE